MWPYCFLSLALLIVSHDAIVRSQPQSITETPSGDGRSGQNASQNELSPVVYHTNVPKQRNVLTAIILGAKRRREELKL
ncbi:hypothetical protein GCK32_005888 [Trichostrongylus colubriformis]|uniref:Secreted protein n=1 Tax=Trichostrongylus colubriformis TaxID=6319 RepID=A0AAN8IRL5_TRICO